MTPFDHAKRIVQVELVGHNFVVALADEELKLSLSMGHSAERADQIALIARTIIAGGMVSALRDEDCRLAAEIEQMYRSYGLNSVGEAIDFCRKQKEFHTVLVS